MKSRLMKPLIITRIEYGAADEAAHKKLAQLFKLLVRPGKDGERSGGEEAEKKLG